MAKYWWEEVVDIETAKFRIYNAGEFTYDQVLPYLNFNDKIVLDFGCGIGRNLRFLCQSTAKEIYGFDLPNMVELSKQFLTEEERNKIKFLIPPINEFPKVDFIIALIVLQHLDLIPLNEYLQMFKDCLNPNGIIYIMGRGYIDHEQGCVWDQVIKYFTPITSLYSEDWTEKHQAVLFKPKE